VATLPARCHRIDFKVCVIPFILKEFHFKVAGRQQRECAGLGREEVCAETVWHLPYSKSKLKIRRMPVLRIVSQPLLVEATWCGLLRLAINAVQERSRMRPDTRTKPIRCRDLFPMGVSEVGTGLPPRGTGLRAGESMAKADKKKIRLAIIISHPIQYYAPLYQRLARRDDLAVKVFFTWHLAEAAVKDHGFRRTVAWDIPLTEGYASELVPNVAADPGTHHFLGLRNPTLVKRVQAWSPDVVHITGWAWHSNFTALRAFAKLGVRTLFRGDSHLLDPVSEGPRWWIKRAVLRHIFAWPTGFLVVGAANRAYYEAFGVSADRLFPCPHSIDVPRFAEPSDEFQRQAAQWRQQLGIAKGRVVLLFAGKFERKKRPIELMRAVQALHDPSCVLILVGNGELEGQVNTLAATDPERFRVLPFQNQSRMPIVYRLGDLFVLPSAHGETWGLGVNEAMACGRPVLVSDRVGCASDAVSPSCGFVFAADDSADLVRSLALMTRDIEKLVDMGRAAAKRAWAFDIGITETRLIEAVHRVCLR
jgi:glycosyltransferase involved in cell wall biosynthesis